MRNVDEARERLERAETSLLTSLGAPLTEASLSRVLRHWQDRGFAIVSADRATVDRGGKRTINDNLRWRKRLKTAIRAAGYGFIPLDGRWIEDQDGKSIEVSELSFLVPSDGDIEKLRAAVLRWAKLDPKDPQDAVILSYPGGPVRFLAPDGTDAWPSASQFVPGKVADIYSRLRNKPGTFVFEGWWFHQAPDSFSEAAGRKASGELTPFVRWEVQ
jgi:hypothetical protein